jgi:FkbM family methyltransferase
VVSAVGLKKPFLYRKITRMKKLQLIKRFRFLPDYLLGLLGLKVVRKSLADQIDVERRQAMKLAVERWTQLKNNPDLVFYIFENLHLSYSQIQQDLFVLYHTEKLGNHAAPKSNYNKNFFVEFGGANGKALSNTYTLEKNFGWNGIVCEPSRVWRNDLEKNRSCRLDFRCVFNETGSSILFKETLDANLSTIFEFAESDLHKSSRLQFKEYQVETVTLNDLLIQNDAPRSIAYISIDTEGSEYEILKKFDFTFWNVEIFSIEHNFGGNRAKIHALMVGNGYTQVHSDISFMDDWYVRTPG